MINNVRKGWKTTLMGILFLLIGVLYIALSTVHGLDVNEYVAGGLVGLCIAFLFFPDDFLKKFRSLINNFKQKKSE